MKVALRSYSPADFEMLFQIDQVCYPPEIAYSRRELRDYLHLPGADCVVAEGRRNSKPGIIGFCVTAHEQATGYVVTIDVLDAYRRQGVGAAMLAEAERHLAASGAREIGLETATDNAAAIAFWEKHGYRSRGILKAYYPNGVDALSMWKSLEGS